MGPSVHVILNLADHHFISNLAVSLFDSTVTKLEIHGVASVTGLITLSFSILLCSTLNCVCELGLI